MRTDEPTDLGRALDVLHDACVNGIVHVCGICAISTDEGWEDGHRHAPQPDELARAAQYVALFSRCTEPPATGGA